MKLALCLVLLSASVFTGFLASDKNAFTLDQIPCGPVPAFLSAGAQLAVLEGDPTAATGDFTVRLKMPDGYRIPPHWHPHRENVAVSLGNFTVGMGDSFEESKMMTLRQAALPTWTRACTTMRWQKGRSSFRYLGCRPYSSTTSTLTTTRARKSRLTKIRE